VSGHSTTTMPDVPAPHPVETTKDLADEAGKGRSPRTPLLAMTGVTVVVAVVLAVILTIVLLVYYLA
jgi:hypothetical protein